MMSEILEEMQEEINELNAYYDKHIRNKDSVSYEEWDHYAGWYKELFGNKPAPADLILR